MSDSTNYRMTLKGNGFDPEFVVFKLLKNVKNAGSHISDTGATAGNGYDWRTLEDDMRGFSKTQPDVLFEIMEYGTYENDSFESRHYFKNGRYVRIEPVITKVWPEFTEGLLA